MLFLALAALLSEAAGPGKNAAPSYTSSSIVNAASNASGALAPNCIATVYGEGLAWGTRGVTPSDIAGGRLPTTLTGTGARVVVNNLSAHIYFASPTQINFLVPANLAPGPATVQVAVDGRAGPAVRLELAAAAPGIFAAVHADGSLVSKDRPAAWGEQITLYAAGLGQTTPEAQYGEAARGPAPAAATEVLWAGEPAEEVSYAGLTPGFAGLYQVNFRVPAGSEGDIDVRLRTRGAVSPEGFRVPAQPPVASMRP